MTSEENDTPAADAVAVRIAEEYFVSEMILRALMGPFLSPRVGGGRVMEPILAALVPEAPRIIHYMCGQAEDATVRCDERDVQYLDGRQILTRQEVKILRWAEKNLTQNGRDIYVSMVALRIMIGAVSPDIRTYCCIKNGDLVLPALPVRMRLLPDLGVAPPDVPTWSVIVRSLVAATGRGNAGREMERLLITAIVDLGDAIGPAMFNTNRQCAGGLDRDNEVGERIHGIMGTISSRDWELFDGRPGGGGRIAGGGTSRVGIGKKSSPAPRAPRPRGRVLRPRWG
ncbi:hypothetical protein [Acidomonas methanolica]|uniref:Uncharacterized protein n=1 Tax=Acidomonas methanolica NBRC 104435 TaxID=1231351 RepID=A0A023D2M1_ACIMT|nr:hypothetical protein [Acidomonas methanolica]TCS31471.1 hypothetical protein EDC31_10218 [Acidomonas methanolica]GAJ28309.1 hypothetical protein Amme_018_034 [Acidomonas methanolica NBRC 104435]GBQ55441.1 hypothetical protein AA0498_2262 [Acidomonas methanolica]GEK97888.1 hypothetical protein AME01nite_03870 [Acidomonas methanolica NBRC 104435]